MGNFFPSEGHLDIYQIIFGPYIIINWKIIFGLSVVSQAWQGQTKLIHGLYTALGLMFLMPVLRCYLAHLCIHFLLYMVHLLEKQKL